MASVIKIKRSDTSGSVPSGLEVGEIAVNLFDRKLYVGNTASGVSTIGGEDFRLTSQDVTTTGDGAYLKLNGDSVLSTNSVALLAGEGLDVTLESNGSITFAGEDATTSNKGIASFSSDNFDVSSGAVTIKDGGVVNAELANKTITNAKIADGTLSSTQIASKGISANSIADGIITSAMISAGGVTANAIGTGAVTSDKVGNDAVALGTKTTGNYVATVTGTANEIEVSGSGSETAAVTIGLPNDVTIGNDLTVTNDLTVSNDATVSGNLTVDGNLTVEGGTTYLSTSTVYTDDGMFKMSANNAGDATDTGIYNKYVVSGNSAVQYAGYFRDATDGVFKFYKGLDVEPTSTVDTTDSGYGLATVDCVIDGGSY